MIAKSKELNPQDREQSAYIHKTIYKSAYQWTSTKPSSHLDQTKTEKLIQEQKTINYDFKKNKIP